MSPWCVAFREIWRPVRERFCWPAWTVFENLLMLLIINSFMWFEATLRTRRFTTKERERWAKSKKDKSSGPRNCWSSLHLVGSAHNLDVVLFLANFNIHLALPGRIAAVGRQDACLLTVNLQQNRAARSPPPAAVWLSRASLHSFASARLIQDVT